MTPFSWVQRQHNMFLRVLLARRLLWITGRIKDSVLHTQQWWSRDAMSFITLDTIPTIYMHGNSRWQYLICAAEYYRMHATLNSHPLKLGHASCYHFKNWGSGRWLVSKYFKTPVLLQSTDYKGLTEMDQRLSKWTVESAVCILLVLFWPHQPWFIQLLHLSKRRE